MNGLDDFKQARSSPKTAETADAKPPRVFALLGAAGGIGSALARRLSSSGAKLLLGGRSSEPLEALAEEIGAAAMPLDAAEFDQVGRFLERAGEEGELLGAANCAGSLLLKPAHLTTAAEFATTLSDNLMTSFALVRAAGRVMRKGGSVVLVSSAAALTGLPNHEAIAAAKAGVAGLARSAAATYASRGLRVNCVAPGLVATPLTRKIVDNEKARAASVALHPLGRIGQPDDVALLMAWLLGPQSGWVTGQVLPVDGGLSSLKTPAAGRAR